MMRLLFVCHGNICRSPMAEFVMKDLVQKAGRADDIQVESAALHTDEIGSDIHSGTRGELVKHHIPFLPREAWLLTEKSAADYDLILAMDEANMSDLRRLLNRGTFAAKVRKLLSFVGETRDVADPWYTGDFETTYADIVAGCTALLKTL